MTSALRNRARPAPAVERCPASLSEMFTIRSRRLQQRRHPEQQARHDGHEQGEQEDYRVEGNFGGPGQALRVRREHRPEASQAERGADGATGRGEHDTLGHELTQQAPAARAERRADREFLLAGLGPCKQQVGEVRARDQQHEADRSLEHPEGRAGCRQRGRPAGRRAAGDGSSDQGRASSDSDAPLRQHRLDVGSRLRLSHTRLQPADEIEEVPATISGARRIQRERQPHRTFESCTS